MPTVKNEICPQGGLNPHLVRRDQGVPYCYQCAYQRRCMQPFKAVIPGRDGVRVYVPVVGGLSMPGEHKHPGR